MNGKRFTAVIAALALILSAFAAPGVFAGFANASDHTGISASPDNAGETATVTLTEDVPSSADTETFASFKINAENTDFSNVAASDVTVGIDTNGDGAVDTTQSSDISSVSTADSGTTLTVSMNTGSTSIATLADSDDLIIEVANAQNPSSEGDYSVSTDVNTYDAGSHTLDIIPPLSSTTFTVEDRQGNAVSGATIAVDGSTYTTDSSGQVSANLTAWEHTAVVSADSYDDATRDITISEGGDSATVVVTEPGAVYATGNVEGVQIGAKQAPDFVPFDFGFLTSEVTSVDASEEVTNGNVVVDLGADVSEDISADATDGEGVSAFTVKAGGELIPVYPNGSVPSDVSGTYGVYDADNGVVTVETGDEYANGDTLDVSVSSEEMGISDRVSTYWMNGLGFDGLGIFGDDSSSDSTAVIVAPSF